MSQAPFNCKVVDEYLPEWPLPADASIIITHMHYRWEEIHWLRRAYESGDVPILILADGILEYRNTWEHPDLAAGAIFQPVMGHKLACIGRNQARTVESWGNVGKCELVGLPRFDSIENPDPVEPDRNLPFRILIATANTPAFNETQRETVIESLLHIRKRLQNNQRVNGRTVEVVWRLTDGLESELDLPRIDPEELPPLSQVLDEVDGVITTPSTLFLESIYKSKPTAILDFHNCPHYVNSAWFINAPKHLNWILSELENPPPAKLLFQANVLNDELEHRTPAAPRLYRLVQEMIQRGAQARKSGQPIEMAHRILEDPQHGFARVPDEFQLATLYPNEEAFRNDDLQRLQVELNQAIERLGTLPRELQEKSSFLADALECLDRVRQRSVDAHAKNVELHDRIISLRERLGIRPKGQTEQSAEKNQPSDQSTNSSSPT